MAARKRRLVAWLLIFFYIFFLFLGGHGGKGYVWHWGGEGDERVYEGVEAEAGEEDDGEGGEEDVGEGDEDAVADCHYCRLISPSGLEPRIGWLQIGGCFWLGFANFCCGKSVAARSGRWLSSPWFQARSRWWRWDSGTAITSE